MEVSGSLCPCLREMRQRRGGGGDCVGLWSTKGGVDHACYFSLSFWCCGLFMLLSLIDALNLGCLVYDRGKQSVASKPTDRVSHACVLFCKVDAGVDRPWPARAVCSTCFCPTRVIASLVLSLPVFAFGSGAPGISFSSSTRKANQTAVDVLLFLSSPPLVPILDRRDPPGCDSFLPRRRHRQLRRACRRRTF